MLLRRTCGLVRQLWRSGVAAPGGRGGSHYGLYAAFLVVFLMSWGLILMSWGFLVLRTRLVRGYAVKVLYAVEACSVLCAILGHSIMMYFAIYYEFPPLDACQAWRWRRRRRVACDAEMGSALPMSEYCGEDGPFFESDPARGMAGLGCDTTDPNIITTTTTSIHRSPHQVECLPAGVPPEMTVSKRSGCAVGSSTAEPQLHVGTEDDVGTTRVKRMPSAGLLSASPSRVRGERCFLALVCVLGLLITSTHLLVHHIIPNAYRQSQEITLSLARVGMDLTCAVVLQAMTALRVEKMSARMQPGGARASNLRLFLGLCASAAGFCVLYALVRFLYLAFTISTIAHLQMSVLGGSVDVCALEGLMMDPKLSKSWALPALTHRRLLNFYTGSESCARSRRRPAISFVEEDERVLLVSPVCVDGSRPRVYLHRPENSEFSGADSVALPETERGNKEYHRQLEALYGTAELARRAGVVVHRHATSHLITAVEIDPSTLAAVKRAPRSLQEKAVRSRWPREGGGRALRVPLGRSPAYTVYCPKINHEEYHLWPLDDAMLDVYATAAEAGAMTQCVPHKTRSQGSRTPAPGGVGSDFLAEPAGNVFVMLFDAVSRQEIRRSLPKFARALAELHRSGTPAGHIVVEAKGAMTLGVNTAANLVPFLAGITARAVGTPTEARFTTVSFMNRTVFELSKNKYGDALSTSLTSGFCHDLFEFLLGHTVPSSGAGGRVGGVDRYYYAPFCHLDYSGYSGNFRGPYSIVTRCMAGEAVWEHTVNYTERLLAKQLNDRRRATANGTLWPDREGDCGGLPEMGPDYGKFFFHIMYMTEGHEGTHGVLPLLDETLTRFFHDLRTKLHFFDDPLNTFVLLADHGSHMGPYYEFTQAGKFERGTPPFLMAVSPEVMNRIDYSKGRAVGTSLSNLHYRASRMSMSLDVYPTLGDLLNISVEVYEKYRAKDMVHAASMFDLRDDTLSSPLRQCAQLSTPEEHYPCPLDFCIATR